MRVLPISSKTVIGGRYLAIYHRGIGNVVEDFALDRKTRREGEA